MGFCFRAVRHGSFWFTTSIAKSAVDGLLRLTSIICENEIEKKQDSWYLYYEFRNCRGESPSEAKRKIHGLPLVEVAVVACIKSDQLSGIMSTLRGESGDSGTYSSSAVRRGLKAVRLS